MNFQFLFPAVLAQIAPYSTLGVGALWSPDPDVSVKSLLINVQDSSTTSGFDDIGDGTTWWTQLDYKQGVFEQPGGGSLGVAYAFDGEFARIGGINFGQDALISINSKSSSWAVYWSGWQYLFTEESKPGAVDPTNGVMDHEGLGVFTMLGLADEDANPVSWTAAGGLSGRGSIPGRSADTWALGFFYNDLQDLGPVGSPFMSSVSGWEAYYDIALTPAVGLTLDAQFLQSAFNLIDDATIVALRLNVSL
jgi:porin